MSKKLRGTYENVDLTPGRGHMSATLSIALGVVSLFGAFCFLAPDLFTTPEFQGPYNAEILRMMLPAALAQRFGTVSGDVPEGVVGQFLYPWRTKRHAVQA